MRGGRKRAEEGLGEEGREHWERSREGNFKGDSISTNQPFI